MTETRVSLAPEDQTQGASFFNDVDVEIVDAECKLVNYVTKEGVTKASDVPAFVVKYRPMIEGGEQHDFEERYSAGDKERVQPAADGDGFVPAPGKTADDIKGLSETSRSGQYLAELVRAGYPSAKLKDGRVKQIIGTKGHLLAIDPPKRGDKDKNKLKVITKVISLPDAKTQAGSAAAAGVETEAAKFIALALTAAAKAGKASLTMTQLSAAANKKYNGNAQQLGIVSLLLDQKFLAKQAGWAFNGREVSAAAVEDAIEV